MKYTYDELAGMIDHSLLHPTMTDREIEDGCRVAVKYRVASVCIKPYYTRPAAELLKGSNVKLGVVVGFPHGNSTTESKRYETELACKDGAVEIDMVINIGKALGGDWDYVVRDIIAHAIGLPQDRVRVMARDVGGGFGLKGLLHPEDIIIPIVAYTLRRPVRSH